MVTIRRSPTGLCWWVLFNGNLIQTTDLKREAKAAAEKMERMVTNTGLSYAWLRPSLK